MRGQGEEFRVHSLSLRELVPHFRQGEKLDVVSV
jgi:hypothetical protein